MITWNRRDFLRNAGALMAAGLVGSHAQANLPAASRAGAIRALGKTGIKTTLLGMGTGTHGWKRNSDQIRQGKETFLSTLTEAYELGLRYFDLADMYGSHPYMREAMQRAHMKREELTLLTKTVARNADGVRDDIERFRKELDTDYIDIVLLHCMTSGDWVERLKPCMDVLSEYKTKGIIRAHGVSCHNLDAMKNAAASPWVDVMLSRINPFGLHMDGTIEEVVDVLRTGHAAGKGMLGMKIAGEGQAVDRLDESLRFVLNLGCIDAITIGFVTPEQLRDTVQRIERIAAA
jgi:predicted aldo/keto reductase-like oxidoreductase